MERKKLIGGRATIDPGTGKNAGSALIVPSFVRTIPG
jgi:hypothetical protein